MNVSLILKIFLIILLNVPLSIQLFELKCLVCEKVVKEINEAVINEDPRKTVQVGSFRIQPDGSQKKSQIKYAGSEIHLNDILEKVCNNMENYAQAKHKETGALALINLEKDLDKMDIYQLIPDPDLNRSLKYYCESFVGDYEDDIMSMYRSSFAKENSEVVKKLCSDAAGYCSSFRSEL